MEEKKYVTTFIKEVKFPDGGSLLNCSILLETLEQYVNESGWVKITIAERRTPSEKGATHYAHIDEYEPQEKQDDVISPNDPGAEDQDTPF